MVGNQICKVCNHRDKFNFTVPDYIWNMVVPKEYQNRVVCLSCFDDFAYKKNINIKNSLIGKLYFVGDMTTYTFNILSSL